jgi:hypothetical protein
VLPETDNRFDQELVGWFALHRGDWSGTAAELLAVVKTRVDVSNDLWPQSPRSLYAYMESHTQVFRSWGMAILLPDGYPRLISIRSCQDEKPVEILPSGTAGFNRPSDPQTNPSVFASDQKNESTDFDQVSPATDVTFSQYIAPAKSHVITERSVKGIHAHEDNFERRIFDSIGETLFAVVEMRVRIEEQGLDLKSAIDLVVGRTQEITRSAGVAVGLFRQEGVVYPARAGVAATMGGLHFHANLFQSCRKTRQAVQLCDAQKHPQVGATCLQEGIGSLIIVPIFHNREVAGAMEVLFKERRSFSTDDVIDLELIADVIGGLGGIEQMEMNQGNVRPRQKRLRTSSRNSEIHWTKGGFSLSTERLTIRNTGIDGDRHTRL